MNRTFFGIVALLIVAGCQTSGGNSDLNEEARIQARETSAKHELEKNRRNLAACILQVAAMQRLENKETDTKIISRTCASFETSYRASVMANVNPSLQHRQEVLTNTANTATRNLYSITLKALS